VTGTFQIFRYIIFRYKILKISVAISDRFKVTGEHKNKAWEDDNWLEVGTYVCNPDSKKKASVYKISSFDVTLGISDWRLIVVYSSELEK